MCTKRAKKGLNKQILEGYNLGAAACITLSYGCSMRGTNPSTEILARLCGPYLVRMPKDVSLQ